MKIKIIVILTYTFLFLSHKTCAGEDIFTDYCKSGLCKYTGGDGMHSGCKNGVHHNGQFQHPPCSDDAAVIPLTDEEKQSILDYHNVQRNFIACGGLMPFKLRPACRMGAVEWDKELEATSFLHASFCTFAHDKCRGTVKYPFSGQNLGVMNFKKRPYRTPYYINCISYLWYLEYHNVNMKMINEYYNQEGVLTGHFLTLANERNNRIGCTFVRYNDSVDHKNTVLLSCNYPTTNIEESTIYNSCKNPGSKCTSGRDPKYKYLCSTKEVYDVSGFLDLEDYDGDGTEKFNCGRRVELYHYEHEGAPDVKVLHTQAYPNEPIPVEGQDNQIRQDPPGQSPAQLPVKQPVQNPGQSPGQSPIQSSVWFFDLSKFSFCLIMNLLLLLHV